MHWAMDFHVIIQKTVFPAFTLIRRIDLYRNGGELLDKMLMERTEVN